MSTHPPVAPRVGDAATPSADARVDPGVGAAAGLGSAPIGPTSSVSEHAPAPSPVRRPTVPSGAAAARPGNTQLAPPAGVPLGFLAAAAAGLVGFGVALAAQANNAVIVPTDPHVVATVHLAMLAFLSTAVLGAIHQFGPVVGGRPLRSVVAARISLVLFVPAVWMIPVGFATAHPAVVSVAGVVAFCAICLIAWNVSRPLGRGARSASVVGLRWAVIMLIVTALFGVVYAFDRHTGWFPLFSNRVLAHAHLGLLGWLGLAYVSVAEKLWPMFLLAHRPSARAGDVAVRLLPAGVLVLAGGLLFGIEWVGIVGALVVVCALASHLVSLSQFLHHRRRRLELLHAFVLTSAAFLVAAVVIGAIATLAPVSTAWRWRLVPAEVACLFGWLALAVIGHVHKIIPFVEYTALRSRGVKYGPGERPLRFADLFESQGARAAYVLTSGGLVAVVAGLLTQTAVSVRAGAIALAVVGVLVTVNMVTGFRRVQTLSGNSPLRDAGGDPTPSRPAPLVPTPASEAS